MRATFEFFESDRDVVKLLFRDSLVLGDRFDRHLAGIYEGFITDIEKTIAAAQAAGYVIDAPPRMIAFSVAALVGQLALRRLATDDGVAGRGRGGLRRDPAPRWLATQEGRTMNTALVQVLGAVAYGEWKAYEGAKADALAASDEPTRRRYRKVAAEELRHHKGFVARLDALGADPERAMRPYRLPLDRYHAHSSDDPIEEAVFGYLGEGVADDLLHWLRTVVDPDTAAFIDTVIEDEVGHEADAAADLRAALDDAPDGRRRAVRAARKMVGHMLWSGRRGAAPLAAFVRLGRPHELIGALLAGHVRRMSAVGLVPFGLR